MTIKQLFRQGHHVPYLLALQVILIILFVVFVDYYDPVVRDITNNQETAGNLSSNSSDGHSSSHSPVNDNELLEQLYPRFQDVHVMMFIGFGFLMTYLKRYGYSAISFNFLIAAIILQWATLCQGFFHMYNGKILVNISSLLTADFACATVLISFGSVLGVTTPLQLIVMALIEIAIFACNEHIGLEILQVSDIGASMLVHVFGAYFGLAVSFVLRRDVSSDKEGASYTSDMFAMIGTLFLWLFWPSFNAGLAVGDAQHRAIINTYYSLAACCVTAFAVSSLVSKEHKFDMVHIQNSTLAGGVAIGTAADMMVHPYGALIVGAIAGTVSVLGYRFLTPVLNRRLGIHDTCGVHNLHGMPGILAGIVGAIMAGLATKTEYKFSLYSQFPARIPMNTSSQDYWEIRNHLPDEIEPGFDRTAIHQALYQMAGLGVSLALALVGGLVTGLFLRLPMFGKVQRDHLFDDYPSWELPEESMDNNEDHPMIPIPTILHPSPSLPQEIKLSNKTDSLSKTVSLNIEL